jgi:hypothetical protein
MRRRGRGNRCKRNVTLRPLRYGSIMRVPSLLPASLVIALSASWSNAAAATLSPVSPASNVTNAPSPVSSGSPGASDDSVPQKDAGTIVGKIQSIDYHTGLMTVEVAHGDKKTVNVLVVPGTNIQGAKDFHTIADLKKGERVQVLMSQRGSTYTAQIIRLL